MTKDEARIVLLEDALAKAGDMIRFMDGCLTRPDRYTYAHPGQAWPMMATIELLSPRPKNPCVHSRTHDDCSGCQDRNERFARTAQAKETLAS